MDETSVLEHISRSIGNGETAVLADRDESGPATVDGATAEKVRAKLRGRRERLRRHH